MKRSCGGHSAPKGTSLAALAKALGVGVRGTGEAGPWDAEDLRRVRESMGLTQAEAAGRRASTGRCWKREEAGAGLPPNPKATVRVYGLRNPA